MDRIAFLYANPIESTLATVRHRTTLTKNRVSRSSVLGLAFTLVEQAQQSRRRIQGAPRLTQLQQGMVFKDGLPASNGPAQSQRFAA